MHVENQKDYQAFREGWKQVGDFSRITYTSRKAQLQWQHRIKEVVSAVSRMQWESVFAGIRPGAVLIFPKHQVDELREKAARYGCEVRLRRYLLTSNGYANRSIETRSSTHAGAAQLLVAKKSSISDLQSAFERSDSEIGRALGFPECCIDYFERTWGRGHLDPTHAYLGESHSAEAQVDARTNILLRWLGVRPVFHLPCSLTCAKTRTLAEELDQLEQKLSPETLSWRRELLQNPIQWSANHGIGEVLHPVVRLVFNTDWTPEKRTLRLVATHRSAGSPVGGVFPFNTPEAPETIQIAKSPSQDHAHDEPSLNGFSCEAAMRTAHDALLSKLRDDTGILRALGIRRVIDLGSGSGRLLSSVLKLFPESKLRGVGVEADVRRAERAKTLYPNLSIARTSIRRFLETQEVEDALLIVSPKRFNERDGFSLATMKALCSARAILFYSYDSVEQFKQIVPLIPGFRSASTSDRYQLAIKEGDRGLES